MSLMSLLRKLFHYFNLEPELDDFERIHQTFVKDSVFRGTNLWILVFAIIVASVGLNMNSTAVIIGAMLISPLMGPINAVGYSIATYHFELFRSSLKNFAFAVIASLLASTTYFALSPVSTAHSELLARTSPTIYDVLIALFGGLAGVVAISSKQKGNVIPGVAIATALMPPLCTAGYGLATGQFDFFFGALYLFTINTVFIALASAAISQLLKFPIRTIVDSTQKKRINSMITAVIMIVLLPSIYFGYLLVQNERFTENANRYLANVATFEGNYLLKSDINPNTKVISLVYGGINLSDEQRQAIISKADQFRLQEAVIDIKQGLAIEGLDLRNTEALGLREELDKLRRMLQDREMELQQIQHRSFFGKTLLEEIQTLYPQIEGCTYAESLMFDGKDSKPDTLAMVVFTLKPPALPQGSKEKIEDWLKVRLARESLMVLYD